MQQSLSKYSNQSEGFGGLLQAEIKVLKNLSIAPSLGIELPYIGYLSLTGRYYINHEVYVLLGVFVNAGGDDGAYGGFGKTAGFGFALPFAKRHVIDFNFHGDMVKLEDGYFPVGGIRITYNFSFIKLKVVD